MLKCFDYTSHQKFFFSHIVFPVKFPNLTFSFNVSIQNKSQLFHNEWPEGPLYLNFQDKNRVIRLGREVNIVNKKTLEKMRRGLTKVFEKVPLKFGPNIVKKNEKSGFSQKVPKPLFWPVLTFFAFET